MVFITLTIIILITIFDISLSYLNYSYRDKKLPSNVKDVYSEDEYNEWLDYSMERRKIGIFESIYSTIILLVFFLSGLFVKIANFSKTLSNNFIIQNLLFLLIYFLISYILSIGFDIYKTFSIEERYGFNKTTIKTFISDQIKSLILTIIIGGGLLFVLFYFHSNFKEKFIVYSSVIILTLVIVINLLYTKVFIRIFNKLEPLEENALYKKILNLANDTGYKISEISVLDASKRSSRLNAFFSGFSKFKQIVLYDTLVEKFDDEEILSVLAHEIGHYKHKDIIKNIIISIVQITAIISILSFLFSYNPLSQSFGFSRVNYGFTLILFSILAQPIMTIVAIPLNYVSRQAEYKADAFACKHIDKEYMISALKKLSKENFSNLNPHPLVVTFTYSHPPLHERLESIKKREENL